MNKKLNRTSNNFYKLAMNILKYVYLGVGLAFLFGFTFLENILGLSGSPHPFWVALTVSMMCMLSFIAHLSSQHSDFNLWRIHFLSKTVSTLCFLFFYLYHYNLIGFLVGTIVDGALALTLFWFYKVGYVKRK